MRDDVPIPKKMNALGRDSRGYPIPFNVVRDRDGRPHFAVNDHRRQERALKEKRCGICGTRISKPFWFVGGPRSAFHEYGAYLDPAMHHECMTYAMQVCPYLAIPKYLTRIDAGTVDVSRLDHELLIDHTIEDGRPPVFVCVSTNHYEVLIRSDGACPVADPDRPYLTVEYWRHGKQLSSSEAQPLVVEGMKDVK